MTHKNTPNTLDSLLKTMQSLRAPNGCPWDAEQTPASLTPFILEEACELIDAIEDGSPELIIDELGDLLLQVVFLAQIYKEQGQFNFYDVAERIADKLIRRHPHVFARKDSNVPTAELDKQWDKIKRSESTHNKNCLADHLPSKLPALQRAQKLLSRAARDAREEEVPVMFNSLLQQQDTTNNIDKDCQLNEETLGQTLFHIVKLAQAANLDAEAALRKTSKEIIEILDRS